MSPQSGDLAWRRRLAAATSRMSKSPPSPDHPMRSFRAQISYIEKQIEAEMARLRDLGKAQPLSTRESAPLAQHRRAAAASARQQEQEQLRLPLPSGPEPRVRKTDPVLRHRSCLVMENSTWYRVDMLL